MKASLPAIVIASACGNAAAQTVDHAALEQLFGESVTTSVTGSPQRESDVPASMEIISSDDIRRSGARDLPTLLRHVVGVDVMQTSMSHGDVGVRGYNQVFSPRLLVLLDGRQVYADYYGFTPWDAIPIELEAIRQLEVVRGPNAALFGFNAVGGVINIITYSATDDVPDSATATIGTQGVRQLAAVSGWRFGESAGLRLSVGRRDNEDFATPGIGPRPDDSREAVNLEGRFAIAERIEATIEAAYSNAKLTEITPAYMASFGDYETRALKAEIGAETRIGLVQASFFVNDSLTEAISPVFGPAATLHFDNTVRVAQVGTLSKLGSAHTVRLSLELRDDEMATTPIGGADVFYDVTSLSAMWEWRLADTLTLTNALRFDRLELGRNGSTPPGYSLPNTAWDRAIDENSFNTAAVWRVSDADVLRFTVARGVQLPSLYHLGGAVLQIPVPLPPPLPPFGYFGGVPTLQPTVVTSYEVSWNHALGSTGAQLRVSTFHGRTHDVLGGIGGADLSALLLSTPVNIGDSHVAGLEIAIEGEHEEWRWGASYAPIKVNDEFVPGYTAVTTLTDFEHTTPRNVLKGNLGWARGPWEVDGYLRYQSSTNGIAVGDLTMVSVLEGTLVPLESYLALDGRLGYRLNDRMTVAVAGQGLTRSEQRETAAGGPVERRILASFRATF
jgi:outer membrane receptor for ferrienterochelin and colicins